jgi:Zn-dependent M16 (insulinase) family peptidase
LENLFFTRALLERLETDWDAIVESFHLIREKVVRREGMLINLTLDNENWQTIRPHIEDFTQAFPSREVRSVSWDTGSGFGAEGLTIPAQVNYVGKGANLFDLGYQPHGSMSVIRKYLGTTYIWEKIRVQGGAYGGFTSFDLYSGTFNYISYRDPNLIGTLENYDGTPAFLKSLEIPEAELKKAIIGAIGDMDGYQLPDAKGYTSMVRYLSGYTDDRRQQYREEILSTTGKDFKALGDLLEKVKETGTVAVLGSAEAIAEANQEKPGLLTVKPVL